MYDLGAPIVLTHSFIDSSGNPATPTSIVVTIQLPDQTATTVTPTTTTLGAYTAGYTPAQTGRYAVTWVPTGGDTVAFSDVFNVGPQFSAAIVSLAEMRAKLNKKSTADDDMVRSVLRAATAVIEGLCGPCAPRTVTETVSVSAGGVSALILSQTPLLTVTSITPVTPFVPTPDLTSLSTDLKTGVLTLTSTIPFWGQYVVTYTAGRAVIPQELQEACLLVGRNLYELQRGGSIAVTNMGSDEIAMDPSLMVSVSPRVRELVASEIRAPGV